jgi:hypothetical protein
LCEPASKDVYGRTKMYVGKLMSLVILKWVKS